MQILERPDLLHHEQLQIIAGILYEDEIEDQCWYEAVDKAMWFLDGGDVQDQKSQSGGVVRLYSWEQDARYIIAAVDRVLGRSCRSVEYLHWWDFLSAFMEIGDCTFSTLVHQRRLKKKHKQSREDKEWWAENREIAELKIEVSLDADEQAALNRFHSLLG